MSAKHAPPKPHAKPEPAPLPGDPPSPATADELAAAKDEAKAKAAEPGHQQLDDLGTKIPEAVPGLTQDPLPLAGERDFVVDVPGCTLPRRTVRATDRTAAVATYMADLGVFALPSAAEVHPVEPPPTPVPLPPPE